MKVIKVINTNADIGDLNSGKVKSCFSRPSTATGYDGARYLKCSFGVRVVITDDLGVYVSINGGNVSSNDLYNATSNNTRGWPKAFLAAGMS